MVAGGLSITGVVEEGPCPAQMTRHLLQCRGHPLRLGLSGRGTDQGDIGELRLLVRASEPSEKPFRTDDLSVILKRPVVILVAVSVTLRELPLPLEDFGELPLRFLYVQCLCLVHRLRGSVDERFTVRPDEQVCDRDHPQNRLRCSRRLQPESLE